MFYVSILKCSFVYWKRVLTVSFKECVDFICNLEIKHHRAVTHFIKLSSEVPSG